MPRPSKPIPYPCPYLRFLEAYRHEIGADRAEWQEAWNTSPMGVRTQTYPSLARVACVQLLYPVVAICNGQVYRTVADAALDVPLADPYVRGQAARIAALHAGIQLAAITEDVWPDWEAVIPATAFAGAYTTKREIDLSELIVHTDAIDYAPGDE